MEWHEISAAGKRKFIKWFNKQTIKHNIVCASAIIRNAPNEHQLVLKCRHIETCRKVREEFLGIKFTSEVWIDDDVKEKPTEDIREIHKASPSATQLKYEKYSSHTKGRILDIINRRMDIPISRIIMEADSEADVIKAIEDIKEIPVNPEVRKWTVRRL